MYKRILSTILLLVVSISPSSGRGDDSIADSTIKVGWAGPLTGDSAVLGVDGLTAAQIAFDEVNSRGGIAGRRIELIVEDDGYDAARSVSAFTKLSSLHHVSAILMPTYGGIFATAKLAVANDVIVIDPLDCNEQIAALPANTLCLATQSESVAQVIARNIQTQKFNTVGILYDQSNAFMDLVAQTIRQETTQASPTRLILEAFDRSTSDFRSQMGRFRAQEVKAIVFLGHDTMGLAMAEARRIGIQAQFYSTGTITSPGFQKLAGPAAEGTLVAFWEAPNSDLRDEFLRKFRERTGRMPILELVAFPSYDATRVLISAIESSVQLTGGVSPSGIRTFLLQLNEYRGVSGALTMSEDGAVRSIKESLHEFRKGNLVKSIFSEQQR